MSPNNKKKETKKVSKKPGTSAVSKTVLKKNIKPKSKTPNKTKTTLKKSNVSKLSLREEEVLPCKPKILGARKSKLPKKQITSTRGVVFLRHIPHGFYEREMRDFFSQFGEVTGVRVPRSKRTGKYRGYAFVEFLYPDVAKIASETMQNYLMYKRVIKTKYLEPEEQKPFHFRFPVATVPLVVRRKRLLRKKSNQCLNEQESEEKRKRLEDCVQNKLDKLKKLGISYEFQVANRETASSEATTA